MEKMGKTSKAAITFSIAWRSRGVQHRDSLWTGQVNLWRDFFMPELATALTGKNEGEVVCVDVNRNEFLEPYSKNKIVNLRPEHFYNHTLQRQPINPIPGRFYPQGFLHGVANIYKASLKPARYLGKENNNLFFDVNHPLAGYDLTLIAEIEDIQQIEKEQGGRCEDWLECVCADGPGMQARYQDVATEFFESSALQRADPSSDNRFYQRPRMVQHLDSTAREIITTHYGRLINRGSRVLDLMGSWDSHLHPHFELKELTVLGMNDKELAANSKATGRVVQDLNNNPVLSFADMSFDAIICTASIEYLTDPLMVFSEILRVLKPNGVFALSFSNRWFPPKVVNVWTELHEFERLAMVLEMFHRTPGFKDLSTLTFRGKPRPDDDPYQELPFSDPVFMAWGKRS